MNNTLYDVDFTRALPQRLKDDKEMFALGRAIADELQENIRLARLTIIYPRIDELDEELLDILARDLHVDWYEDTHPIAAKRQVIKDSVRVHKRLGTKYAIVTALGDVFPGTEVREWFEYGGTNHRFRILLDITNPSAPPNIPEILRAARFYKRLTAHLDGITYTAKARTEIFTGGNILEGHKVKLSATIKVKGIKGKMYFANAIAENSKIVLRGNIAAKSAIGAAYIANSIITHERAVL